MTERDWWQLIEKDPVGSDAWEGLILWLHDEVGDEKRANAVRAIHIKQRWAIRSLYAERGFKFTTYEPDESFDITSRNKDYISPELNRLFRNSDKQGFVYTSPKVFLYFVDFPTAMSELVTAWVDVYSTEKQPA